MRLNRCLRAVSGRHALVITDDAVQLAQVTEAAAKRRAQPVLHRVQIGDFLRLLQHPQQNLFMRRVFARLLVLGAYPGSYARVFASSHLFCPLAA
ncbi:MAG: hypothetical protein D8H97_41745 [Neisseria sp.]|nr:MAG: hypothetical protein D8H97_41745 [Neisseria sp.]